MMKKMIDNIEVLLADQNVVVNLIEEDEEFELEQFDSSIDIKAQVINALEDTDYFITEDTNITLGIEANGFSEYLLVDSLENPPKISVDIELYRYPNSNEIEMNVTITSKTINGKNLTLNLGSRKLEEMPEEDEVLKVEVESILLDEILLEFLSIDYSFYQDYIDLNFIINR